MYNIHKCDFSWNARMCHHCKMHWYHAPRWRRKWQPTPVFFSRESCGQMNNTTLKINHTPIKKLKKKTKQIHCQRSVSKSKFPFIANITIKSSVRTAHNKSFVLNFYFRNKENFEELGKIRYLQQIILYNKQLLRFYSRICNS